MKHRWMLSALAAVLIMATVAPTGAQSAANAQIASGDRSAAGDRTGRTTPAERCLSNDPYDLDQLADVISRTSPPSTPVIINENLTVEFVRSAIMTDTDDEVMGTGTAPSGPAAPNEQPTPTTLDNVPLRIFNTRTGFEFRVRMSESMLRTISTCHQQNGLTEAGGPGDFSMVEGGYQTSLPVVMSGGGGGDGTIRPFGWSNNNDSRILRTPTTPWPWRTITQSSSWPNGENSRCTMTLIGPRHLITAAHCLVNFGTSAWKTRKLTPARNGINVAPYGFSQMTPNPPPGHEAWYIVPDPWIDPATPDNGDKYQWDIGMVLMMDRLGDQTGWMGYGAYSAGDLNPRFHFNRGYPSCSEDVIERPAGCQTARLYGDAKDCDIGYYHHQGSNGWNRQFAFSCDISRGHSGSPIYHYRYSPSKQKVVPVVIAVVSWHECFQCSSTSNYPNHARRVTPWVLSAISWLKEQFP